MVNDGINVCKVVCGGVLLIIGGGVGEQSIFIHHTFIFILINIYDSHHCTNHKQTNTQARPPKTPSRYKRLKNKLFGRGGNISNTKRKSGNEGSGSGTPPPQSDDKNKEAANYDQDCDGDEEDGPSLSMNQPRQYTISKLSRPTGVSIHILLMVHMMQCSLLCVLFSV